MARSIPHLERGLKAEEDLARIERYLQSLRLPLDSDDNASAWLRRMAARFFLLNGRLWWRQDHGRHQLCIPSSVTPTTTWAIRAFTPWVTPFSAASGGLHSTKTPSGTPICVINAGSDKLLKSVFRPRSPFPDPSSAKPISTPCQPEARGTDIGSMPLASGF